MPSDSDELAIKDQTGGPMMVIPFLLLMEFCSAGIFLDGLRGNISDAPIFSAPWWLTEILSGIAAVIIGIMLGTAIFETYKTFGKAAYLRINPQGIWLPYEEDPIVWEDIDSYYVEDAPWMKGGAMQFLYISLRKRRLLYKRVMIIGRKQYDNEDVSNCMTWIDRFLPS